MKQILFAVIAIVIAVAMAWLLWAITPQEEYRVYDCSLAEFHPDYPPQVREECRRIRKLDQKNFI
jgi:hypothetical protein